MVAGQAHPLEECLCPRPGAESVAKATVLRVHGRLSDHRVLDLDLGAHVGGENADGGGTHDVDPLQHAVTALVNADTGADSGDGDPLDLGNSLAAVDPRGGRINPTAAIFFPNTTDGARSYRSAPSKRRVITCRHTMDTACTVVLEFP